MTEGKVAKRENNAPKFVVVQTTSGRRDLPTEVKENGAREKTIEKRRRRERVPDEWNLNFPGFVRGLTTFLTTLRGTAIPILVPYQRVNAKSYSRPTERFDARSIPTDSASAFLVSFIFSLLNVLFSYRPCNANWKPPALC